MKQNDKSRLTRATLPLEKIHTDYGRFQFRSLDIDYAHVEDLTAAYRRKADIPPITVWEDPDSGLVFVLDGHHRYNALKKLKTVKAKVLIFAGDEDEARLVCVEENAKARLQMTGTERSDAAWRLVQYRSCEGDWTYSQAQIAKSSGVSKRTVGTMRQVCLSLREDPDATIPESWWQAQQLHKGRANADFTEEQRDAWIESNAQQLFEQVGKSVAHMHSRCPDAVYEALSRCFSEQAIRRFFEYVGISDDAEDLDSPF